MRYLIVSLLLLTGITFSSAQNTSKSASALRAHIKKVLQHPTEADSFAILSNYDLFLENDPQGADALQNRIDRNLNILFHDIGYSSSGDLYALVSTQHPGASDFYQPDSLFFGKISANSFQRLLTLSTKESVAGSLLVKGDSAYVYSGEIPYDFNPGASGSEFHEIGLDQLGFTVTQYVEKYNQAHSSQTISGIHSDFKGYYVSADNQLTRINKNDKSLTKYSDSAGGIGEILAFRSIRDTFWIFGTNIFSEGISNYCPTLRLSKPGFPDLGKIRDIAVAEDGDFAFVRDSFPDRITFGNLYSRRLQNYPMSVAPAIRMVSLDRLSNGRELFVFELGFGEEDFEFSNFVSFCDDQIKASFINNFDFRQNIKPIRLEPKPSIEILASSSEFSKIINQDSIFEYIVSTRISKDIATTEPIGFYAGPGRSCYGTFYDNFSYEREYQSFSSQTRPPQIAVAFLSLGGYPIDKWNFTFKSVFTSVSTKDLIRSDINLYPNPVSDYLTVILPEDLQPITSWSIINAAGKEVTVTEGGNEHETRLPLQDLPAGMYMVIGRRNGTAIVANRFVKH